MCAYKLNVRGGGCCHLMASISPLCILLVVSCLNVEWVLVKGHLVLTGGCRLAVLYTLTNCWSLVVAFTAELTMSNRWKKMRPRLVGGRFLAAVLSIISCLFGCRSWTERDYAVPFIALTIRLIWRGNSRLELNIVRVFTLSVKLDPLCAAV